MKPEFWIDRWKTRHIGFHQAEANVRMQEYFPALGASDGDTVLVPLCGKSVDMLWLRDAGYRVIGVEFVEQAVEDFFAENDLPHERTSDGAFTRYRSGTIDVLCGDFFQLDREHLGDVRAVYDRASLIALPPQTRRRYAEHMMSILTNGWRMLLLTIDYDQQLKSGPPFAVSADEVRSLYAKRARVERLRRDDTIDDSPRFQERSVTELWEEVWRIEAI